MIDDNILSIVIRRRQETVPVGWSPETIVQDDWGITDLAQIIVTIAVESMHHVGVKF